MREQYIPLTTNFEGKPQLDFYMAKYANLSFQPFRYDIWQLSEDEAYCPDATSWKAYQDEHWWWVICLYNNIVDIYTEYSAGLSLKIPALSDVQAYLDSQALHDNPEVTI